MDSDTGNQLYGRRDGGEWEWIDEADESNPKDEMLAEYMLAFDSSWEFEWRD